MNWHISARRGSLSRACMSCAALLSFCLQRGVSAQEGEPRTPEWIARKVRNAIEYGTEPVGVLR